MMTNKEIDNRIKHVSQRIRNLFNDLINFRELKNKQSEYYELETKCHLDYGGNISTLKGKKQKVTLGYCYSHTDDFVDEDTSEVVSLKRSLICSVNGEPCNEHGKLFKNMDYNELMKWI